jgi:hypothetical protein
MKGPLLDNALWAASFVGTCILFAVLLSGRRWRQFPIFTTLIGYYVLEAIVLFLTYRHSTSRTYATVYWITFAGDFLLQIALIFEIASIVLKPTGTWIQDARSQFLLWGSAGALIAFGLSFAVHPATPKSIDAWGIRAFLFTSLLFCELFLVIMLAAQRLGLVWKNHVMRLSLGLTVWGLISAMVDVAHSYFGAMHIYDFTILEHVRTFAFIGAVVYWTVAFWLPEPQRRPLSPEMQEYLVALHAKVQYDSSQVSSVQNLR